MEKAHKAEVAANILAANPDRDKVYITADGQPFFEESAASRHAYRLNFTTDTEVFFRDGFTPENETDFEAAAREKEELKEDLQDAADAIEVLEIEVKNLVEANTEAKTEIGNLEDNLNLIACLADQTAVFPPEGYKEPTDLAIIAVYTLRQSLEEEKIRHKEALALIPKPTATLPEVPKEPQPATPEPAPAKPATARAARATTRKAP